MILFYETEVRSHTHVGQEHEMQCVSFVFFNNLCASLSLEENLFSSSVLIRITDKDFNRMWSRSIKLSHILNCFISSMR